MDGRVLGEYGTSATNVIAERIWMQPEVEDPAQPFGGDDGTGGYAPLAVVIGTTVRLVHASHLGVPLLHLSTAGAIIATPAYTLPGFPGQSRTYADLYYNRYRDYDPTTGRYVQADPIGLGGGDSNIFRYAEGDPVNLTDPMGLNAGRVAVGAGKVAGEVLWLWCKNDRVTCMETIGGAAVWVYNVTHSLAKPKADCPDDNTNKMSKGGKRNIKNEITRAIILSRSSDPCGELRKMRGENSRNSDMLKKIKEAEKYFNCDGKNRYR